MKRIAAMILVALGAVFLWAWPALGVKTALSEEELGRTTADPAETPQAPSSMEPRDLWPFTVVPYNLSKELVFPLAQDTTKPAPPDVVVDRPPPVVTNPYFRPPANLPNFPSNVPANVLSR